MINFVNSPHTFVKKGPVKFKFHKLFKIRKNVLEKAETQLLATTMSLSYANKVNYSEKEPSAKLTKCVSNFISMISRKY